jgi:hypothetical protein
MLPFYILFSGGMTYSEAKNNPYFRIIWVCLEKDIGQKWLVVSIIEKYQVSCY